MGIWKLSLPLQPSASSPVKIGILAPASRGIAARVNVIAHIMHLVQFQVHNTPSVKDCSSLNCPNIPLWQKII